MWLSVGFHKHLIWLSLNIADTILHISDTFIRNVKSKIYILNQNENFTLYNTNS